MDPTYDIATVLASELGGDISVRMLSPSLPTEVVRVIAGLLECNPEKRLGLDDAIARLSGNGLNRGAQVGRG